MIPFCTASASASALHTLSGPPTDCISAVRFSPLECPITVVGAASWDKTCRVWQVRYSDSGEDIQSQPMLCTQHDSPILDLSFSADGRAFFGGCSKTGVMWNLLTNQTQVVASHDLPISCISYVKAGNASEMLITGSWDGKLRFWDLRQPRPAQEQILGEPIFALDAQKTFPMAACVTGRKAHIFNLQTMTKVNELKPPSVVKFNFRCVSCSHKKDGVLVGSSEGRISFLLLSQDSGGTFRPHITAEDTRQIMYQTNFCIMHPKRAAGVTGGGDGKISCWDFDTKQNISRIECEVHAGGKNVPISSGDLSADGKVLAYAHSYDWSMGKEGYSPNDPHNIYLRSTKKIF